MGAKNLVMCNVSNTVVFVAASHQTRLDTRSKARRPIKVGIKGRGRSGRSRDSNPACLCCSSAHLVQCEPDEASSFTNPNVGPGTYASLRLKLDAWSSAVQRGQKCSSPTRRLPSRSWGPIRPRVYSWFRAPIRHECQTAQITHCPHFLISLYVIHIFMLFSCCLTQGEKLAAVGILKTVCNIKINKRRKFSNVSKGQMIKKLIKERSII